MVWRGSRNTDTDTDMFTHVLYNRYSPPKGFCLGSDCWAPNDDVTVIDETLVGKFVTSVCEQSKHYKTHHVIVTMGDDFMYRDAVTWFKGIDDIIEGTKKVSDGHTLI